MPKASSCWSLLFALLGACGGSTAIPSDGSDPRGPAVGAEPGTTPGSTPGTTPGRTPGTRPGTPPDGSSGTGDGDAGPPAGEDAAAPPPGGTVFKSHVILGDSISDRGGEAPFFYDLLVRNDDAKWPNWKGKDFKTVYGEGINVVKGSRGGARSINLVSQARALGTSLPGPVLITITIGGNDVQAALGKIIQGQDDAPDRVDFRRYLTEALDELTKPARFGAGVDVQILLSNIYDPSDGTGTFRFANGRRCGGALGFWPADKKTKPLLEPWNGVMVEVAAKYPQVHLLDLRALYEGHGVPAERPWFVSDCIHPNAPGHDAIRALFFDAAATL
jgi:lysophospholipase L1-like esterase